MRTFLLSLSAAAFLAGCACGSKDGSAVKPDATPTPGAQGHVPSILEPNHGMSAAKAAGFGDAAQFLK